MNFKKRNGEIRRRRKLYYWSYRLTWAEVCISPPMNSHKKKKEANPSPLSSPRISAGPPNEYVVRSRTIKILREQIKLVAIEGIFLKERWDLPPCPPVGLDYSVSAWLVIVFVFPHATSLGRQISFMILNGMSNGNKWAVNASSGLSKGTQLRQ